MGSFPLKHSVQFSSVQLLSHVWLFGTPWTVARQVSLSITNSQSLLKLVSIQSVMPSNHLILCRPLLLLPSIFPSIRIFSSESVLCIRWPKYWSFNFNISPSSEYSGLISFKMDWLDLLGVQGTLKSLLQSPPEWSFSLFPLFLQLFALNWWDWMSWSYFTECWVLSQLFHSPLSLSSRSSWVLHFLP